MSQPTTDRGALDGFGRRLHDDESFDEPAALGGRDRPGATGGGA